MKLPDLLGTITVMKQAVARFSADCRKAAADPKAPPVLRDELNRLADEADALLASQSLAGITITALDELRDLVMSGKSIVQHQATDLF